MTDDPIILPKPVTLPQLSPKVDSTLTSITRFLSWLAGCLLAVSVLVALLAVTSDRNDLRSQLAATNRTLACRAAVAQHVNQAIIDEQIALAEHNVAMGSFIIGIIRGQHVSDQAELADKIEAIDVRLSTIGVSLQEAVTEQRQAITGCQF